MQYQVVLDRRNFALCLHFDISSVRLFIWTWSLYYICTYKICIWLKYVYYVYYEWRINVYILPQKICICLDISFKLGLFLQNRMHIIMVLYDMVVHFTLRTYDVNKVFFRKENRVRWLFRCKQMPSTDRTAWFTPCVRMVKWAAIYYKNHDFYRRYGRMLRPDWEPWQRRRTYRLPTQANVVVVYHVTIRSHRWLKKFWPMVIGCFLRAADGDPPTLL